VEFPGSPRLLLVAPPKRVQLAAGASVDAVMFDLERRGKAARQRGFDTQVNRHGFATVRAGVARALVPVCVRINALGVRTAFELDQALDLGARSIMLPMARSAAEVEQFLKLLNRRAEAIVQVETPSLMSAPHDLVGLEWDQLYVGLNDLMVARGDGFLWQPLLDGSLERLCTALHPRRVGFGGLTVIGAGAPLPTITLMAEMLRLQASVTVLRRSFVRDVAGRDVVQEIGRIRTEFVRLSRDAAAREALCAELQSRLRELRGA